MERIDIKVLYEHFKSSSGICTDTRKIIPGSIFFALKGPTYNANEFALNAIKGGAAYAVVDDENLPDSPSFILVDDVLSTLQELAKYHRSQQDIPVIGITGSNGKTTTKELISRVLAKKYKTFATKGNLNNHIGVPLSILSITPEVEIAIIEMGANHIGEIESLCEISKPTHGIITNIGKAHIEGFGSFEGVMRAKTELYQYLMNHNGEVFINSKDLILANMAKRFPKPNFFPDQGDYFEAKLVVANPFVSYKSENGETVKTHLIGSYNFINICAALCIGKFFEVNPKLANEAVKDFVPDNNRSQVLNKNGNTIFLDAYNANPDSMNVALVNFESIQAENKVVILGDMNELGSISKKEHQNLVVRTAEKFQKIFLCGPLMQDARHYNPKALWFPNPEELIAHLQEAPIRNSLILIKASRGIGLERVVEGL